MKVQDCMTSGVCYCTPKDSVNKAIKLMCDNHVGCIPVCDDSKKVVGLLTDRDILLRCDYCGKDTNTTKISEIMTCDVCCCTPEEDITNAEKTMSNNQIRRLPVMDNGELVGILTLGDLAHYNEEIGKENVCETIGNICSCDSNTKNAE